MITIRMNEDSCTLDWSLQEMEMGLDKRRGHEFMLGQGQGQAIK